MEKRLDESDLSQTRVASMVSGFLGCHCSKEIEEEANCFRI